MTAFSLRARLHLGANSDLALSLPQSSPLYPKRLDSSLLRGSRGGCAASNKQKEYVPKSVAKKASLMLREQERQRLIEAAKRLDAQTRGTAMKTVLEVLKNTTTETNIDWWFENNGEEGSLSIEGIANTLAVEAAVEMIVKGCKEICSMI